MAKIIKWDRVHVWEVIYAKLYEVFSTSLMLSNQNKSIALLELFQNAAANLEEGILAGGQGVWDREVPNDGDIPPWEDVPGIV